MDQHGICAGFLIGVSAAQRLIQAPARNKRFDPGDEHEVGVGLAVLARLDLAAEFIHVGQRLTVTDKGICFREQFVFDAGARDAALTQFCDQPADVIEVAVPGIAVHQDRDRCGIGHEFKYLENLGPRGFVRITHTERRRHRKPGRPYSAESRFLGNFSGKTVMRFHQKTHFGTFEQRTQLRGFGGVRACVAGQGA
jgi:hypothetical protein